MTRVLLILSICLASHGHQTNAVLPAILASVATLRDIYNYGIEVKTIAQNVASGFEDSDANVIRHLNAAMRDVSKKLYNVEGNLLNEINQVGVTLLHRLPLKLQRDNMLQDLAKFINKVNATYGNFVFYQSDLHSYENQTIERFMTNLVADSSELNSALNSMFGQLLSGERIRSSLLSVIMAVESHDEDKYEERCDKMSSQKKLFDIYHQMILTEMQGYAMNVYAFGVLKQMHNASYTGELNKLETQFKQRCGQYLRSVKSALSTIPTDIHLCEPAHHIRGKTFIEFVGLFQTFIDKERGRYPDTGCRYHPNLSCGPLLNIDASTEIRTSYYDFSPIQPCMGRLFNCNEQYGRELRACRLMPGTDSRRYAWIINQDNEIYGENMTCPSFAQNSQINRFETCHNCACLCADDIRSDSQSYKRINFQPQIADIKKNMVVTGVRMVMKNRTLHFQIEQGKLESLGEIATVPPVLKSINQSLYVKIEMNLKLLDGICHSKAHSMQQSELLLYKLGLNHLLRKPNSLVVNKHETAKIGALNSQCTSSYCSLSGEEGIDFGNLRYEQRTINLDDVIVPDNFVVTGVKFAYRRPRVSTWDYQPFEIQVHATEYNFDTGKLETWNSIWVSAKTMETDLQDYQRDRTEVTLDEPHNPIKAARNPVFSRPNQFIKLRESDFRKDAGQSTIPYLDSRPVSMESPFALSGIGLYHRGKAGFGGFLGLRLFGLNIAPHMISDVS